MPKTRFDKEEIGKKFKKHMKEEYEPNDFNRPFIAWCASLWDCSESRIRNIFAGREAPNESMLKDMGFKKVKQTWFEKV